MVTRISKTGWTALIAGLFLMSGFSLPVHGQETIEQQECRVGDQDRAIPGAPGSNDYGYDSGNGADCKKKNRFSKFFYRGGSNGSNGNDSCQDGSCRKCKGKGCKSCRNCRCYQAVDSCYCDPRNLELYAAQGYGVPMAVPLAPVVQHTYHYGWGVPSTRLVRVGASYNRWYPADPFTQTGGNLPGGQYPMVYQPTDTTQLGFYHVHAPRWMPATRTYCN